MKGVDRCQVFVPHPVSVQCLAVRECSVELSDATEHQVASLDEMGHSVVLSDGKGVVLLDETGDVVLVVASGVVKAGSSTEIAP